MAALTKRNSPRIGACIPARLAPALAGSGADFFEWEARDILGPDAPPRPGGVPINGIRRILPDALRLERLPVNRADMILHAERLGAAASSVGADFLVFGSGPARAFSCEDVDDIAVRWRVFADEVLPIWRRNNLRCLLEPLSATETNFIVNLADAARYASDFDGFVLDLEHSATDPDLRDFARTFAHSIAHVHLSGHSRTMPSTVGDWARIGDFLDAIHEGGGRPTISFEVWSDFTLEELRACVARAREIAGGST